MKETILKAYERAMRRRDWYFTRLYSWRVRLKRHPFLTIRYALSDRGWHFVVWLTRQPLLSMRTFWGARLVAPFPDYRSLLHHGLLDARELPVEDFLVSHLTEHDVFFDVGANIGYYSALAQALGAKAYAFEPVPRTFEILKKNVPEATLVNKALMDTKGSLSFIDLGVEMAGSNSVARGSEGNITVEATTLDAYCSEHSVVPTCIKMDVEKAEWEALMGAKTLFAEHHPTLIVETDDARVIQYLLSLGYVAYHFDHKAEGKVFEYRSGEALSPNLLFVHPDSRGHAILSS